MRRKNPIARALRAGHLKAQVVIARKGRGSYRRKRKKEIPNEAHQH